MDQYLNEEEIFDAYEASSEEAKIWRKEYPEYERLADNGLLDDLDENLPEVNDGSLAASLFKLAKRVIKKKMAGRFATEDRDDQWLVELANIYWEKKILKNAKSKASPRRKWKDAVRKAAIFGGQPIITLFVQRGNYTGADFIAPYAADVKLEAGKDSDEDSDIIFWDVYYTKLGFRRLIEQAKNENEEAQEELASWKERKAAYDAQKQAYEAERAFNPNMPEMEDFEEDQPEPYNRWDIPQMEKIAKTEPGDQRPGNETPRAEQEDGVKKTGYHFIISFQRGVGAPFNMLFPNEGHKGSDGKWTKGKVKSCGIREWSNPDPTGDLPVHYLYCYQDFINPYGIGIVKLAGGTQNVLDYMRQADILATQIGIRPPRVISGDEDEVDEESMVMAQDANWYVGTAGVTPWNMATGVYQQLPARIQMYQTSLQKFIPTGDTTISGTNSGDPNVSRTPQGLKMADAALSVDDEDFAENVDECYEAVAASMLNTHFANMQGSDIFKLTPDELDMLMKAGLPTEIEEGQENPSEMEIVWDNVRAQFSFEMDAEADKTTDDEQRLKGLTSVADFLKDPMTQQFLANGQPLMLGSKKLDPGELVGEIISLSTDNDKIIMDVTPEDQQNTAAQAQATMAAQAGGQPPLPQDQGAGTPQLPQGDPTQQLPQGGQAMAAPAGAPQMMQANPQIDPSQQPSLQQPMQADPNALSPDEQVAHQKIQQVMEAYNVTPDVAAAMLEAEDQGYEPQDILDALERNGLTQQPAPQPAGAGANV